MKTNSYTFEESLIKETPFEEYKEVRSFSWLGLGIIAFLVVAIVSSFIAFHVFSGNPDIKEQAVYIPPKSSTYRVTSVLRKSGIIQRDWSFIVGVGLFKMLYPSQKIKAGEYAVPQGASLWEMIRTFSSGKTIIHKFTIPEGLRVSDIVSTIKNIPILTGDIAHVPDEGTLLPETYSYQYGDSRQQVIDQMQQAMVDFLNANWPKRSIEQNLLKSSQEAVVLASVVEKETGLPGERPLVAGVFVNRLRMGMRLQSDPTVVYSLTNGVGDLGRSLTLKDLQSESPFNTYRISGLPPAPIACPGKASLLAVLHPESTDSLYFVADGTGGHTFSSGFEEHKKKVSQWREIKKKKSKVN